jgi:tetratricopeptide (TPR) repeat protein
MTTIPEALAIALQHHQGGRLQAAEQIYRQVLAARPNQADAIHLLGVLAHQSGKHDVAVEYIVRAISFNGNAPAFHCNLGEAYRALHRVGEAVACYRRALELAPNYAEAHNNLGLALQDGGKSEEAAASFRRALKLKPDFADASYNLGVAIQNQGNPDEAAGCYRRALELKPDHAEALYKLGGISRDLGRLEQAVACYRAVLKLKPDYAEAHNNLAIAFSDQGKLGEAVACCRRAVELKPDFVEAHNNLGNALKDQGKLEEAVACFRRAVELKPDFAEVHYNLGIACQDLGDLDGAVAAYFRALEAKPDFVEARNNLGLALRNQGKPEEAAACCRRALELKPDYAAARNNLGLALTDMGKIEEATACFQQLLQIEPEFAGAHNNLGNLLRLQERHPEAREAYEGALRLNPDLDLLRLSIAALCPAVFESSSAIDEYRAGLLAQVEGLAQGKFSVDVSQLEGSIAEPPFNLLYHGRDDRPIKEAWARLFLNLPVQEAARNHSLHSKLGLVVTPSHEGIFLRWCAELLRRINPEGWQMFVVCSLGGVSRMRTALSGSDVQVLPVSRPFEQIVKTVREARFDVLCHWETGSDSTNYFLPYFRLAPVQCNLAGIQATSGIPQMDYYLSSEYIEAEGAEALYSEKLIRARSLLGYHTRPPLPATVKPREAFGFRADQHLYICPQNLRKFHPDFDPLLAGILQQDPAGVVVIVEDRSARVTPMLRRRFAKTIPDVLDRVVFLPLQPYGDYLCLVAAADVVLDPLYYSGGTTTLEAFSLQKPIVTWPGRFQIGRGVLASYRKMGITGFVANNAAEYVRMAVDLGADAGYRQAAEREIGAASGELFEDLRAVREYERIFTRLIEEARSCGRY